MMQYATLVVPDSVLADQALQFGWMIFSAMVTKKLWINATFLAGDATTVATTRMLE